MTQLDLNRQLATILKAFKRRTEAEVRKEWREEKKLIYVREYTVKAHMRKFKARRRKLDS